MHSRVVSAKDFLAAIPGEGGPGASDATYATVTMQFLRAWGKQYLAWLRAHGVATWSTNHDCDNKAILYWQLPLIVMPRTPGWINAESLALGVVWYVTDQGGAHAINVAMLDDRSIVFIEPQIPGIVDLSEGERKSVYMRLI